jgi:hypothetical protein
MISAVELPPQSRKSPTKTNFGNHSILSFPTSRSLHRYSGLTHVGCSSIAGNIPLIRLCTPTPTIHRVNLVHRLRRSACRLSLALPIYRQTCPFRRPRQCSCPADDVCDDGSSDIRALPCFLTRECGSNEDSCLESWDVVLYLVMLTPQVGLVTRVEVYRGRFPPEFSREYKASGIIL